MKSPTRFLTHDETVEFTDRGGATVPFRLRVWQGRLDSPLVLVSQVVTTGDGRFRPSRMTCKIANFINAAVLGHPPYGMLYYEDEIDAEGVRHLHECCFEFFGYAHRLQMYKPSRRERPWGLIEHVLGGPLERLRA